MSEITWGPKGTQLIVVEGAKSDEEGNLVEGSRMDTAYFLGYEDANGTFFLWSVPEQELSVVTDLDENLQRGALKEAVTNTLPNRKVPLATFNTLSINNQIVSAGNYAELKSDLTNLTPVQGFLKDMQTIADELYWWKDGSYINMVQENYAETGSYELNAAQMAGFLQKYDMSEAEYNAAITRATDKKGYESTKQTYYNSIVDQVTKLGGEISEQGMMYLATQWANGLYNTTRVTQEIVGLLDPYSNMPVSEGFKAAAGDTTPIETGETKVQELLNKWLPKHMHNEINIAQVAGDIRNKGGYEAEFIEDLKDKRFAQYGMYERDIAWNNIINTYVSQASDIWGVQATVDDPVILDAVQRNNQSVSRQELKKIGLERGYQKTVTDFASGMADAFGTGIVKSAGYLEG